MPLLFKTWVEWSKIKLIQTEPVTTTAQWSIDPDRLAYQSSWGQTLYRPLSRPYTPKVQPGPALPTVYRCQVGLYGEVSTIKHFRFVASLCIESGQRMFAQSLYKDVNQCWWCQTYSYSVLRFKSYFRSTFRRNRERQPNGPCSKILSPSKCLTRIFRAEGGLIFVK